MAETKETKTTKTTKTTKAAKPEAAAEPAKKAEKKTAAKAPAAKKAEKEPFLMYKGRPLVRSGNTIYYGKMNEEYVVMLQILSTKEENGMTVADKVQIQVIATDPEVRPKDRIVKKSEKTGLYNAMDIGAIWLDRALAGKLT